MPEGGGGGGKVFFAGLYRFNQIIVVFISVCEHAILTQFLVNIPNVKEFLMVVVIQALLDIFALRSLSFSNDSECSNRSILEDVCECIYVNNILFMPIVVS
ncbi:hypothetical protein ACJX0J_015701 [Zea mays]